MAKHKRELRTAQNQGQGLSRIEHTEVFDDNLLPDASEIQQLSSIDPNILPWLKERAAKEQDFRHDSYEKRLNLTDKHDSREHTTTRIGLIIYFLLVFACILAAFILIREGKNLEGTIFGGVGGIVALAILLNKKSTDQPQK
jgi:uncharacterized membrane protein